MLFKPNPNQFFYHFIYVDDYKKETKHQQSYAESIEEFEGSIVDRNVKYKVLCNKHSKLAFISSSLLCNIKNILENHLKTEASMFAYGKLRYDPKEKVFHFEG